MKTLQKFTRIKTSKVLLLLAMIFASLSVHAQEPVVVSIGVGEVDYNTYPFYTYFNYSLTEQLYTAEEIGMAGTIHSIAFFYSSSDPFDENGVKLYMKNVTRSAFASESDIEPLSVADLVWNGTFSVSGPGWVTITLDTPFDYVGDNLLVACFDGTEGYPGYSCNFSSFFKETELSGIYWSHDQYCPDPYNTASGYEGSKSGSLYRNIIQLGITPAATPKPMMLKASNIAARVATLSWTSSNQNVLNFQYQYKADDGEWTALESTSETSVNLTGLDLTTTYTFRVKAVYAAGESDFSTITFTTKSACEQPTDLTANVLGDLTYATLSWSENGEATNWVLQYDTEDDFSNPIEVTTGFVVEGTNVSYTLTGLIEQTYYARVKPACDTEGALWSSTINFVPSYASLVVNGGSSSTSSYVPVYGYQAASRVYSQFIIPSERLDALAGGLLKRFTFHTTNYYTVPNWGNAQFEVYVAEVDYTTFSTNAAVDWTSLTQVYSGSLVVNDKKMIVTLNEDFMYEGGNLLIGFKQTVAGTGYNVSWYGVLGDANSNIYGIEGYGPSRANFLPMVTFGYMPTSYPRMASIEEGAITSNSATFSWTSPNSNVTGYAYQYKLLSDAEWPAQWSSLNTTTVTLSGLSQATDYRFRVKVLYGEHESVPFYVGFTTECGEFADVPFFENFDSYAEGEMPRCWNRIAYDGFPRIYEYSSDAHSGTKSLQLWKYNGASYPDQYAILPQMQNIRDLRVRFYARRAYSSTASSIVVGVMTDPTDVSTFQEIATCDSEGASYQKIKVSLASYTGDNGYIAFKTATTPCYFYIDDVTVEAIPDCDEPEALEVDIVEAHAATFAWTDSGNPNVWQIYVSTDNVMPAEPITANLHNVSSNPATVSGLAPVTEYYAWVRSNCGSSGYSPWSDPVSFTTDIACPQLIYFEYPEMSDIAATYALLRWQSDGQETAWQICLNDDEDHLIDANNNTFTVTGLTPATEYSVKVRANCGGEDGYSEWSDKRWFMTDFCDPEYTCNISFSSTTDYYLEGEVVFMSGEEEVTTLQLNEGLGEVALCPGEYSIVWRGYGNGTFAIYGSDGNEIYSTG
ncbi:MAG: fibronectin type III domain-containing protein, partial [Bacteroidales bacterium]|nr:fibronectin type III domain-containing protein [Bacteroidales bacterium]